jgi:mannose/fructose-specific phosphotransferase system component IIA
VKRILLATHGSFASGIKSSIEIIVGEQENIYTIDAYIGETSFEDQLNEYLDTINLDDDILFVITDVFGGRVNQTLTDKLHQYENVHIITGLNLPLLLELQMLNEEDSTKENISNIVENSKQQIQYVEIEEDDVTDDFDF